MEKQTELITARNGAVCTLTINRPQKRNSLTPGCLEEITVALEELAREDAVRVVVIRGAGDRVFSAGYDITALPTGPRPEGEGGGRTESPLDRAIGAIRGFPYPVIAMLNGDAYGGGCELAVSCDIRVAAARVRMGMPPAKLGLVYPYGGYKRFLGILGLSRALEVFLVGRVYGSSQCLAMGLVNYVAPDDSLEAFTYGMAEEISGNAPLSLRGTKTALYKISECMTVAPGEEMKLQALFLQSLGSEDVKEGKQAFLQKRKPRFTGK